MFHKSVFGELGSKLPCDIDGYVPEEGDHPEGFRFDLWTSWDDQSWNEFVARAVAITKEARKES